MIDRREEEAPSPGANLAVGEASARARPDVLLTLSHDLRNGLAAIIGRAQLLRRGVESGTGADSRQVLSTLSSIETSARTMTEMIEEVLEAPRVRGGESLLLQRAPADLVHLVQTILDAHAKEVADHPARFEPRVPSLLGRYDVPRLRRVVANLLSNAVKYSPPGAPICVRMGREPGEGGGLAVLAIEDRGIGIPAADLPHIFEPFHRAANATGRVAGTGLGLAGAKQIVELHGGTLTVESVEGEGSTFTVRLPLSAEEA